MKEIAVEKIRNAIEDLVRDKKTLVKLLSIVMILMMAAVLKICGSNNSNVTVEDAGTAEAGAETSEELAETGSSGELHILFVDISGAVKNPGVYQVAAGTRLFEVVGMAGGLTDQADPDSINQASYVEDGEKIIIPSAGEAGGAAAVNAAAASSSAPGAGNASAADLSSLTLININVASKEELTTLNGIGDVIAERIIEYRTSNKFKSIEDIKSVKGIGDGIYDKIKDDITC